MCPFFRLTIVAHEAHGVEYRMRCSFYAVVFCGALMPVYLRSPALPDPLRFPAPNFSMYHPTSNLIILYCAPPCSPVQTSTRLQTLREVYDHQAQLIATMSKNVGRLRGGQEDAVEKLEEICDMADEQRVRLSKESCMPRFR